ncbi:MAG TPA: hypothetical protein VF153_05635, partial [Candidatus Limnocylindria bacterium]
MSAAQRLIWIISLAALALITTVAAWQWARLLTALVRRWPDGAGPGGAAGLVAFAGLAIVLVSLPFLRVGNRIPPGMLLALAMLLTFATRLAAVLLSEAPMPVDG